MSCFFFFFSSRRRHTRYIGDWSSDVCSSDLAAPTCAVHDVRRARGHHDRRRVSGTGRRRGVRCGVQRVEIGRASCRERVWMWGGAAALKKKKRDGVEDQGGEKWTRQVST